MERPEVATRAGDALCEVGQGVVAPLLVAFHVQHEVDALADLAPGDELDHELQRAQRLASAAYEQAGVVAGYLEDWALVLALGLAQAHHGGHAQVGEDLLQNLGGHRHQLGSLFEQGDPYPGRLASYSHEAGLAAANDVYFYFRALCVELS